MNIDYQDVESIAGLKYNNLDDAAFADAWLIMSHNIYASMIVAHDVVDEFLNRQVILRGK
jgi:hypothetical protein